MNHAAKPVTEFAWMLVSFFDQTATLQLVIIGSILYTVGRRQGERPEHFEMVYALSGCSFLAYFFYRYQVMQQADKEYVIELLVKSASAGWVMHGVYLLLVPLGFFLWEESRVISRRVGLAVSAVWNWSAESLGHLKRKLAMILHGIRRIFSRGANETIAPEAEQEVPTYAANLESDMTQIKDEFKAEQRTVKKMRLHLEEDEQQEIDNIVRQKMLRRLVEAIDEEVEE